MHKNKHPQTLGKFLVLHKVASKEYLGFHIRIWNLRISIGTVTLKLFDSRKTGFITNILSNAMSCRICVLNWGGSTISCITRIIHFLEYVKVSVQIEETFQVELLNKHLSWKNSQMCWKVLFSKSYFRSFFILIQQFFIGKMWTDQFPTRNIHNQIVFSVGFSSVYNLPNNHLYCVINEGYICSRK